MCPFLHWVWFEWNTSRILQKHGQEIGSSSSRGTRGQSFASLCVCPITAQARPAFWLFIPRYIGIQVNRNCLTMAVTRVGKRISLFKNGHMCCLMQVGDWGGSGVARCMVWREVCVYLVCAGEGTPLPTPLRKDRCVFIALHQMGPQATLSPKLAFLSNDAGNSLAAFTAIFRHRLL